MPSGQGWESSHSAPHSTKREKRWGGHKKGIEVKEGVVLFVFLLVRLYCLCIATQHFSFIYEHATFFFVTQHLKKTRNLLTTHTLSLSRHPCPLCFQLASALRCVLGGSANAQNVQTRAKAMSQTLRDEGLVAATTAARAVLKEANRVFEVGFGDWCI